MPPRGRRLKRPALPHSGCQDSSPAPTLPGPALLCRQTRCRACIFLLFLSLYLCNFPQPFTLSSPSPPHILLPQYTLSCPLSNPWSHFHCYMPTCICTYYIFLNTICSVCVMLLACMFTGVTIWYGTTNRYALPCRLSLPLSVYLSSL